MITQAPSVSVAPAGLNSDLCDIMDDSALVPAAHLNIYYYSPATGRYFKLDLLDFMPREFVKNI